jgi:hypothetical protein
MKLKQEHLPNSLFFKKKAIGSRQIALFHGSDGVDIRSTIFELMTMRRTSSSMRATLHKR